MLPNYLQQIPNVLNPDQQRTQEWFEQRRGRVTASEVFKVLTKGKGDKPSKTRRSYAVKLASERITGVPSESIDTLAMAWGREQEEHAVKEFETKYGLKVESVGFIKGDGEYGVSPDGFVSDGGLIETKCKNSENHLEIILTGEMPEEHKPQVQMQMMVTGRKHCYFVSYDPRYVDEHLRLFVVKVERDDEYIAMLKVEIEKFLVEVDEIVDSLRKLK